MATYETEEEQIEAIKKWWDENGRAVITGLVLGALLIVGWRLWNEHQRSHAEEASTLYGSMTSQVEMGADASKLLGVQEQLVDDYDDTAYAALGGLLMAKLYVEENHLDAAKRQLLWVIDSSAADGGVIELARLRLARLLLAKGEAKQALEMANEKFSAALLAAVEELKGDAQLALGNQTAARDAYSKALAAPLAIGDRQGLQMKLDDLEGVAAADSQS